MAVEAGVLDAIDAEQCRPINAATLSKRTGYNELLIGKIFLQDLRCQAIAHDCYLTH